MFLHWCGFRHLQVPPLACLLVLCAFVLVVQSQILSNCTGAAVKTQVQACGVEETATYATKCACAKNVIDAVTLDCIEFVQPEYPEYHEDVSVLCGAAVKVTPQLPWALALAALVLVLMNFI
jgi:hypothetical protein